MKKVAKLVRRQQPPFKKALAAAKRELAQKIEERESVRVRLQLLNGQIPNLQHTVQALEAQLSGKGVMPSESAEQRRSGPQTHTNGAVTGDHGAATSDEIPPEIRAQLPPEDMSKLGSHYGTEAPAEETLPEITGQELIPEEKK